MNKKPRVKVTKESKSGRNEKFQDTRSGKEMTRAQFVREIESGNYSDDYHIRKINDVKTPVSNPDRIKNNNLG